MDVLDGVISELRSLCASLPDKRTGSNIRHEMADFGLLSFSLCLHAEPVVPGPSACTFARAGAFERRDGEVLDLLGIWQEVHPLMYRI